jgi:hypothetical protein
MAFFIFHILNPFRHCVNIFLALSFSLFPMSNVVISTQKRSQILNQKVALENQTTSWQIKKAKPY